MMDLIWISLGILLAVWIERKLYLPQRIHSIDYQIRMSQRTVIEGEPLQLEETVTNKGMLPFSLIKTTINSPAGLQIIGENVQYYIYNGQHSVTKKYSLLWFQRAIKSYNLVALKRGLYHVKLESLRYSDALLLDENTKEMNREATLVVYPRIYDIQEMISNPLDLFGNHFVHRWIHEDYFFPSGVREYQSGDPLRLVDWKQTAKFQEMMIRKYDYTNSNQLNLILNLQTKEAGQEEIIEEIIRVGASIIWDALEKGFCIGLYVNSGCKEYPGHSVSIPPQKYQDIDPLFNFLARLNPVHIQNFELFLHKHYQQFNNHADFIIVTSYIDDGIFESICFLKNITKSLKVVTVGDVHDKYSEHLSVFPAQHKGEFMYG